MHFVCLQSNGANVQELGRMMDPLRDAEKAMAPGGIARWAHELRNNIVSSIGAGSLDETTIASMMLSQRFSPESLFPPTEREILFWEANFAEVRSIFDICHCIAFAELCDDVENPFDQKWLYEHYARMLNELLTELGHILPSSEYIYSIQMPPNQGNS